MVGQTMFLSLRCSHSIGESDNNQIINYLKKKDNFQILLKCAEGNRVI